jgi:hypothetical protein
MRGPGRAARGQECCRACCASIVAITMWLGDDGTTMTVDGVMA